MQKDEHNWERFLHYYACPACGCILENRKDYTYEQKGPPKKKIVCYRCGHQFITTSANKRFFSNRIGTKSPAEIEWGD